MNKKTIIETFSEHNLDAIISLSEQTKLWYTKVSMSDGLLFIEPNESTLFADGRYIEYAKKNAQNANVVLLKSDSLKEFVESKQFYKRIGVEKEYITLTQLERIRKYFPDAQFVEISATKLRIIKSDEEIKLIKKACSIALKSLQDIKKIIKPGVTEKQIDAELEKAIRLNGGSKGSFDAIVVSGKRGALPHGKPSNKKIKEGELVTIDFGAIYKGYCSDITRTFAVGKLTNKKLIEIAEILKEAQKRGVAAVKPEVSTLSIDKICRDYITEKGFGKFFVHGTGHGLGIDVHELPVLTSMKEYDSILKPGMVLTVEPGIYIEGFGGIRIEDDILVTKTGHKVLSK